VTSTPRVAIPSLRAGTTLHAHPSGPRLRVLQAGATPRLKFRCRLIKNPLFD